MGCIRCYALIYEANLQNVTQFVEKTALHAVVLRVELLPEKVRQLTWINKRGFDWKLQGSKGTSILYYIHAIGGEMFEQIMLSVNWIITMAE